MILGNRIIDPGSYELELREEALEFLLLGRKSELVKAHDVLEERINNASSENPVTVMDECELQELKYILDYIEALEAVDPPF
jgi:hypothetical protein